MSLKVRASGVSHLSTTFRQTTHFAVLFSLFASCESVTEYRAPQCGQKKVRPSKTGPT
jgi:uncharacterized membrane protein